MTSAYDYLTKTCNRWGGNAVVGIQVTTSIASFSNGTFLYTTYTGTAVKTRAKKTE
ncbi:MAG TPA: heavy metal-binding domain-containing protein [Candidatus Dorea intestinavium]|nr:heavy metal-binding domain-containing protein [Candidatus Dorea intestinavium]